ncbi:MAG: phosphatidate cytidylyltransferase [Desulfobulbaceae bacterium]|jgi:phosphatidate cytidylyltransferase|nr:phosphatidate cytidylyltransferase [Desulfobulbaceae bacterium]
MITRFITALIVGPLWVALLYFGTYPLIWGAMTIIGAICIHEYFSMVLRGSSRKFILFATACCTLPLLCLYTPAPATLNVGMIIGGISLFTMLLYGAKLSPAPFELSLRFIFGLFYCSFLLGHIILIAAIDQGPHWLLALTLITTCSDSGAYFIGKSMGRHKLCPHISPGKTIEGFIGGIICGSIGGVLVTMLLFPEINLVKIALIATFLSVIGVGGDLSESIIKRGTNTKDSGHILPGHGGCLDRIDSLLFCGPVFYYILYFNLL